MRGLADVTKHAAATLLRNNLAIFHDSSIRFFFAKLQGFLCFSFIPPPYSAC